jgi:hypothetical protein
VDLATYSMSLRTFKDEPLTPQVWTRARCAALATGSGVRVPHLANSNHYKW